MSCARSSCKQGRSRILGLMAALITLGVLARVTPWPYQAAVVAVEVVVMALLITQAATVIRGVR